MVCKEWLEVRKAWQTPSWMVKQSGTISKKASKRMVGRCKGMNMAELE